MATSAWMVTMGDVKMADIPGNHGYQGVPRWLETPPRPGGRYLYENMQKVLKIHAR